ncbi:MAG: hypothetical protein IPO41_00460 [Acidobacteria bacterium]|nr:hypothetical protein [Acidobacteriota bacterium]MBP7474262.1 hypothetical protein [Pyrinomonadaceae bacterium]
MNLLLDECVTNYLKPDLVGHTVSTIDEAGFKGLKNGTLLAAASPVFDVLITVDQNLRFQQNIENFDIAILVFRAGRSTYPFLKPLVPQALAALETISPGDIVIVTSN